MVCIYCGNDTQVINSRHQKRLNQVWRRRRCLTCGAVFTSHESASLADGWRIKTSDGSLQPFLPNKLFISIHNSCQHRPHSIEDATALTATVISRLNPSTANGLLESNTIIATARAVLEHYDQAAYTHYAAFHVTDT